MNERERKKEILKRIHEAGDSENYETSWDEKGIPISKKKVKIKKGKSARQQGAQFELRVRKDLEKEGKIIDKWTNNVDLENQKVVPAKRKFNPFRKMLVVGTGFPDFISIKNVDENLFSVIGVECKMNGKLSKEEKEKCTFYLKNKIFSQIWIAKKGEKRGQIIYEDFSERHKKYLI